MKSALECLHRAAECERMATDVPDRAGRMMLVTAAAHWRALGRLAKANEANEGQDPWPPARPD